MAEKEACARFEFVIADIVQMQAKQERKTKQIKLESRERAGNKDAPPHSMAAFERGIVVVIVVATVTFHRFIVVFSRRMQCFVVVCVADVEMMFDPYWNLSARIAQPAFYNTVSVSVYVSVSGLTSTKKGLHRTGGY